MRNRQRVIVQESDSGAAGTYAYSIVPCTGPTVFSSQSVGAWFYNTRWVLEAMSDGLGKKEQHGVRHRRMHAHYVRANKPFISVIASPPYGLEYDVGLDSRWSKEHYEWFPEMSDWNVLDKSSTPYRWSITLPTVNDSVMINNVVDRSKGLVADVLLNIVEANQIWPSLKSLTTCLPNLARNWRSIRKVMATASGGYLAWKFGVSPILSDIVNINKFLPKLAESVKRHADGETTTIGVQAKGSASFNSAPDRWTAPNGVIYREHTFQGLINKGPVVRYVLVVKPVFKYGTEFFKNLSFAMSRFASSPASLAWEKVPFSFVADWFVDLRGTLGALDKSLGFSPYEILSFTKSFSYDVRGEAFMTLRNCCDGSAFHDSRAVSVDYRHYERFPVSQSAAPVWKPRFGKNQAGISAALIAQQLSKL